MAELKKSVLGKISGTIGEITFRQRKGKNIIAVRPRSFIPGNDSASIERRNKFALSARFAQAIYSLPILKMIWSDDTPPQMSPFNNIIRKNVKSITSDGISELTKLTPDIGFTLSSIDITYDNHAINVSVNLPDGFTFNEDSEFYAQINAIAFLSEPSNQAFDPVKFLALASDNIEITNTTQFNFVIKLTNQDEVILNTYQKITLLTVFITLDDIGAPVRYSDTYLKQLK